LAQEFSHILLSDVELSGEFWNIHTIRY